MPTDGLQPTFSSCAAPQPWPPTSSSSAWPFSKASMSPGYRFLRGSHVLYALFQPTHLHRNSRVPPTALDSMMYSRSWISLGSYLRFGICGQGQRGDTGEPPDRRELYKPSGMGSVGFERVAKAAARGAWEGLLSRNSKNGSRSACSGREGVQAACGAGAEFWLCFRAAEAIADAVARRRGPCVRGYEGVGDGVTCDSKRGPGATLGLARFPEDGPRIRALGRVAQ